MKIDSSVILSIFEMLNKNNIKYVLLRNIDNELPENFEANKDIDILVNSDDMANFKKLLKANGWQQTRHPWDFGNNFVFLYAMDKLEFFTKDGINLDVCYQLCCRSVNNGEWMPVDQLINNSVWENRRKNRDWDWYEMCEEDEFVHLLTRCVFDKKEFNDGYRSRIEQLFPIINIEETRKRLDGVFFSFTDTILAMLKEKDYDNIIHRYLTFMDY